MGNQKEILYNEILNKFAKNRRKVFKLMDDKEIVERLLVDGATKARVQAQKFLKELGLVLVIKCFFLNLLNDYFQRNSRLTL